MIKTFTTGLRPWKNHTTALRARKCTPFGGWRHHLPPGGGDFILRYALSDEARLRGVLFCPCIGVAREHDS